MISIKFCVSKRKNDLVFKFIKIDLIRPSPFGEEDIWLQGAAAIALHRYKEKNFH